MPPDFPTLPSYKSLVPSEQKACLRVRQFLAQDLALDVRGHTLLLAVSGGADSLALLVLALLLRPVLGHAVTVAHVDHGLRPESNDEARYVANLAAHWHIPCYSLVADVRGQALRQKAGLEETARDLRYALLEEARVRAGAQWICTGHHAGDLREDMLMRLTRGTGWPALGGMEAIDNQRRLLRPLLMEEPQGLRDLLRQRQLFWMEDHSNADVAFTRNRVRHHLLPSLMEENPAFGHASRQLWRMAQDDAAYWEQRLAEVCEAHCASFEKTKVLLPARLLRELHRAERMRLYMRALRHLALHCGKGQPRSSTLYHLDEALTHQRGGTVFQLPGGISAQVKHGSVTFLAG